MVIFKKHEELHIQQTNKEKIPWYKYVHGIGVNWIFIC